MKYYRGSTLNAMDDALAEITEQTDIINDYVLDLQNIDWDEIFEHVPDSQRIHRDILVIIENIETALNEIRGE